MHLLETFSCIKIQIYKHWQKAALNMYHAFNLTTYNTKLNNVGNNKTALD